MNVDKCTWEELQDARTKSFQDQVPRQPVSPRFPVLSDFDKEVDPFEGIHMSVTKVQAIVQRFWEGYCKKLEDETLKNYVVSSLTPELLLPG